MGMDAGIPVDAKNAPTAICEGRFMIRVARDGRRIVIVEPDNDASLLVVVTAYEVSE
jgi:hypothetical protein